MNKQELPSLLEAGLRKLKQISEKYSSKSALGESPEPPCGRFIVDDIHS